MQFYIWMLNRERTALALHFSSFRPHTRCGKSFLHLRTNEGTNKQMDRAMWPTRRPRGRENGRERDGANCQWTLTFPGLLCKYIFLRRIKVTLSGYALNKWRQHPLSPLEKEIRFSCIGCHTISVLHTNRNRLGRRVCAHTSVTACTPTHGNVNAVCECKKKKCIHSCIYLLGIWSESRKWNGIVPIHPLCKLVCSVGVLVCPLFFAHSWLVPMICTMRMEINDKKKRTTRDVVHWELSQRIKTNIIKSKTSNRVKWRQRTDQNAANEKERKRKKRAKNGNRIVSSMRLAPEQCN